MERAGARPDDKFYVVAITNQHHLAGLPDPVTEFIEKTSAHTEELAREGLQSPAAVQIPVEVYSLSSNHKGLFERYGVVNRPMTSGADEMVMRLYFFSENAKEMARQRGVNLPPIVKEITRRDLPEQRGNPVPLGQHVWIRTTL
jgi:hypothetical protein